MLTLNNLPSLVKKRKRVGRGGKLGGTAGKGNKGQKARSGGYIRLGFEGGQMPLFRRLPKRGFNNYEFQKEIAIINIGQLNALFQDGATINKEVLVDAGLVKVRNSDKGAKNFVVKVLGNGKLSKKLTISADAFSKSAVKAIEQCGGEARLIKEM